MHSQDNWKPRGHYKISSLNCSWNTYLCYYRILQDKHLSTLCLGREDFNQNFFFSFYLTALKNLPGIAAQTIRSGGTSAGLALSITAFTDAGIVVEPGWA